jgi:hypothetical protein
VARLLPIASTLLALAFDFFLLLALGFRERNGFLANDFAAFAFASVSLLPAVLLDIALRRQHRALRFAGYVLGVSCASLHLLEILIEMEGIHALALILLSIGFALLALAACSMQRRLPEFPAASLCLFFLSLSFLHFLSHASETGFWAELVLHHAGIPVALFVILQEYRFLLLDAFVRLAANGAVAAAFVTAAWNARDKLQLWIGSAASDPFDQGLVFVLLAGFLLTFAMLRQAMQQGLTQQVFLRPDPAEVESALRRLEGSEEQILEAGARRIASYFRAQSWNLFPERQSGYEASAALRFLKGDSTLLHLGGRRFLSEDLEILDGFASLLAREVDRARNRELEKLVVEAEWRALQNQIHPHFLFNALNALYGSIPRQASDARRLVLSLSEVFRYFLTASKPTIPLQEELRIIEAYLDIERARLGPRLTAKIDIAPECLNVKIPVLSVQPLVENAIKHGVAACPGPGEVHLVGRLESGALVVTVEDSGPGMGRGDRTPESTKVGLQNVRRRLALQYGDRSSLRFEDLMPGTRVRLELPAEDPESPADNGFAAAHRERI